MIVHVCLHVWCEHMCSRTHIMNTHVHHDQNKDNCSDFECLIIVLPDRCFAFIRLKVPHLSMLMWGLIYPICLSAFAPLHPCPCWTKQILCPIKFLTLQTEVDRYPWHLSAYFTKGWIFIISKPECFTLQSFCTLHCNTNDRHHRLRLCIRQELLMI